MGDLIRRRPTISEIESDEGADFEYEIIHGVKVERSMSAVASHISSRLIYLLMTFCSEHPCGWVLGARTAYRGFGHYRDDTRRPDVSFIRFGKFHFEQLPDGEIDDSPDLAVEVIAPTDLADEVEARVADYRSARVRLVWVVHPPTRRVLIRRLDGSTTEVGPTGELDGEEVIPGFKCRVADLFPQPTPKAESQ